MAEIFYPRIAAQQIFYQQDKIHSATARGTSPPATNGSGQRHVKNERNTARGASPPDEWGEIWAFENGLLRKNLMGEKFRFVRSPARWLLYR